jgi:D-arabinose 5-phosphate isomerase GutQ
VLTEAGLRAHAASSAAFAEADERFVRALAIDEEEARAVLRGIGRAAVVARKRLAADTVDKTA